MTLDYSHLIGQIMDASRAVQLATHEIVALRKRVDDLEKENQRLRDRCSRLATTLRQLEEGEI